MARNKGDARTRQGEPRGKKPQSQFPKFQFSAVGIIAGVLSAAVWIGIVVSAVVICFALDLPQVNEATLTRRPHVELLDASGAELASYGDIYGDAIDLKHVPAYLPAAVVAVEDRRFYQHHGVDVRGLARAFVEDIRARHFVQGGSTITQQVAKNLFLTPDRTFTRKIREALLALKLERMFTKDQILALYMNRVYFGSGIYGFEAASERFFDRPAKDITVFQAAVLAGLLKAPSHYNPVHEPERAKARAAVVLSTMVETGALTAAQSQAALKNAMPTLKAVANSANRARYFGDWVLSQVDAYIGAIDRDIIIRTSLDPAIQGAAEQALARHLDKSGAKLEASEGAVVVLTPDGAVQAMVGGRDYDDSQFNRATQALRQPGSSFKPFVYLTAVEKGWKPDDILLDAPIRIGHWQPQNFEGRFEGRVTMETALAKSLNTATVRLAADVGPKAIVATARRLGIDEPMKPELSLALGSDEVTLLELAGAYAPFANGGKAVLPYAILDITDRKGQVLYRREGDGLGQVIAPETVGVMNRMMSQVLAVGTGKAAAFGYPAAGKTGTSSDFRDAWFMGFTTDYVAGVWVGNDSGVGMKGVTGGGLPAQIWHDVMAAAHAGREPHELPGLDAGDEIARLLQTKTN